MEELLVNAMDADGDTLSVANLMTSAGSIVNNNNGTWTLTPTVNYNGTIILNYNVTDGMASIATTATQLVTPVNDAPTSASTIIATNEDTAKILEISDFAFSDVDTGDTLSSVMITTLPTAGSLMLNGNNVTLNQEILSVDIMAGRLIFIPETNANGAGYASFGFIVSDGMAYSATSSTITVNVTAVNDAPTSASTIITANEDTAKVLSITNFTFSDVDVGNTLTKVMITSLPTAGSLKLNGVLLTVNKEIIVTDIITGKLIYMPALNANGNSYSSFGYKVSDGTAYSVTANTITIDVAPVNDAPTGSLVITGKNVEGEILIASNTLVDVDGMGTVGYQWLANGEMIADAIQSSYTLTSNEIGKTITVRASYTDGYGTVESAISTATLAIIQTNFIGGDGSDTLQGNSKNNILDGGLGADTMIGSTGNDIYYVDNIHDIVIETSTLTTEIDTVNTSLSYTLGTNVENLNLLGTDSINATGNALKNILVGNIGNNILDGKSGADIMLGGSGDDIYYVDNLGDKVYETISIDSDIDATGTDTVNSSITYTIGYYLDNLTLVGTAAINGTGNELNNTLTGNKAANILNGGLGADSIEWWIG